tara:strand:+ start:2462 stop:2752 length:291 start_codon:yes stop_codon:yes gene_type:complete
MKRLYIVDGTDGDMERPYLCAASNEQSLIEMLEEYGDSEGVKYREVNNGGQDENFVLPLAKKSEQVDEFSANESYWESNMELDFYDETHPEWRTAE